MTYTHRKASTSDCINRMASGPGRARITHVYLASLLLHWDLCSDTVIFLTLEQEKGSN